MGIQPIGKRVVVMKKTNVRLVLGSIVLMATVATGCGGYSKKNSPGNPAPAGSTAPYP